MSERIPLPRNNEIERPILWKPLIASLVNVGLIIGATALFYFAAARPIVEAQSSIQADETLIRQKEDENQMTLGANLDADSYRIPLERFYFTNHSEEIVSSYATRYGKTYSIGYLYNINVLTLPTSPTAASYQTSYFSYVLNSDGSVNRDQKGIQRTDLNAKGLDDVRDIYYSAYQELPSLLKEIDPSYASAASERFAFLGYARLGSLLLAFVLAEAILPLFFKNGASLGEKIFHLGYVSSRGWRFPLWKLPLKALLYALLPAVFIYYWTLYGGILLVLGPYFINLLIFLFVKDNQMLPDLILRSYVVDLDLTPIYKDSIDQIEKTGGKLPRYKDRDYIDDLSNADAIDPEKNPTDL
jgi:hypothetical protein